MDLDGQGGMLLMDGYKQRGTKDGLENRVYLLLHGITAYSQLATLFQICSAVRVFVSSTVKNLTSELWHIMMGRRCSL